MNGLSVGVKNSIPNLSCDEKGFVYCDWYEICPKQYCEKRMMRIPEENKCLIFERALYKQKVLDNRCAGYKKPNIAEKL